MYRPNRIESFNRKYMRTIKKKTLRESNKSVFFRLVSVAMKEIKVKPIFKQFHKSIKHSHIKAKEK